MTTIFEERERAFEAEWVHRAELGTRIRARRNRYFAEWAAQQAGLGGEEAAARVRDYIKLDFAAAGEAALLERAADDLGRDAESLREELERFGERAEREILG